MKNIPLNVWRTSLTEDDWNFLQIEKITFKLDEWEPCLRWELYREKVQAAAGGKFPSQKIRVPARGQDARIMRVKIAMGKRAGRHINPDWTSYLSRRRRENWKRLPLFEYDQASWIGLDWHGLREHRRHEQIAIAFAAPFAGEQLRILDGCDTIFDGDGKTEIVPMKIPWEWRDDEIQLAFSQWLKQNRPAELPEPRSLELTGAGSRIRQVKKILKALAAWRLIQHHNGDNFNAYQHLGAKEYLGRAFDHPSEWTDARKAVQTALKQNFASTKVE